MRSPAPAALLAAALAGCSPVYVSKAAAGHASLLWHSRSITSALDDARTPEPLKAKLRLVLDIRQFAFERMGLKRSSDYTSFTPVAGAVSYVVSACPRTSLEQYRWWFPFVGKVPYKGYFKKADALKERREFERKGFDAYVGGVAAYKTPLMFADPLPSSVLEYPPGELAELLIHELTHGTVWFKDQVDFNEALATYVGQDGAVDFLKARFGEGSAELREYREGLARDARFSAAIDEIYSRLDQLYRGGDTQEQKLAQRQEIFAWGAKRLAQTGQPFSEPLDNAAILAHRLYHYDLTPFRALRERCGGDWKKAVAAFKKLPRRDPFSGLKPGS